MSTMRLAFTSRRIRWRPTMRYSSSGGRSGSLPSSTGGNGFERQDRWIDHFCVELHVLRQLDHQGLANRRRARAEIVLDDLDEVRLILLGEDRARLRTRAKRRDLLAQRDFAR